MAIADQGISSRPFGSLSSKKRSSSNRRSNSLPSQGPPNFRLRSTRTRFTSTSTQSGSVLVTNPFDKRCSSRRSVALPNGLARPSLPTTRPRVAGGLEWFGNSPPTPNRRDVCHPCADSNVADTYRDATNRGDKIKRVGRHYTRISRENSGAQQHFNTSKSTCSPTREVIVLKKFSVHSKLRKIG